MKDERALPKIIGMNIRAVREGKGLSVEALAEGVGLPVSEVLALEMGQQEVTLEQFVKLFQCLGIPPARLLEGLPLLVSYPGVENAPALTLRESETQEFLHQFFKVDGPNRGEKFKALVKKMKKDDMPH